jgi:hypothetical protein
VGGNLFGPGREYSRQERTVVKGFWSVSSFLASRLLPKPWLSSSKKADVVKHPRVFDHVGLLFDGPPGFRRFALHLVFRLTSWSELPFRRTPITRLTISRRRRDGNQVSVPVPRCLANCPEGKAPGSAGPAGRRATRLSVPEGQPWAQRRQRVWLGLRLGWAAESPAAELSAFPGPNIGRRNRPRSSFRVPCLRTGAGPRPVLKGRSFGLRLRA